MRAVRLSASAGRLRSQKGLSEKRNFCVTHLMTVGVILWVNAIFQ